MTVMHSEGLENGHLEQMIFSQNCKICVDITLSVVKYTKLCCFDLNRVDLIHRRHLEWFGGKIVSDETSFRIDFIPP